MRVWIAKGAVAVAATALVLSGIPIPFTQHHWFSAPHASAGVVTLSGGTFVAAGGTITTVTQNGIKYRVHTFTSTTTPDTFRVTSGNAKVWYLVVAGGGGGGSNRGGGGGAGGLRTNGGYTFPITPGTYTVTVGDGGAAGTGNGKGGDGGNSVFGTITSTGGGGGGGISSNQTGQNGGSGGGGSNGGAGGTGMAGQGNNGGLADNGTTNGAGGGGCNAVGAAATAGGTGGAGCASTISGSSVTKSVGGLGGHDNVIPTAGAANTGTGGEGGNASNLNGSAGGSGTVIIRYPIGIAKITTALLPGSIVATGGTITDVTQNGIKYKVHTFTTTGSDTFTVTSGKGKVWYLVVAGGGGGGRDHTGGGGAGGVRNNNAYDFPVTVQAYTITVGAGGASNTNGSDSVFSSITSTGGGGGGTAAGTGFAGGSGSGGAANSNAGGAGTAGQGNNGGAGSPLDGVNRAGGGGGGAGSVGVTAGDQNSPAGNGGAGIASSISGSSVTYAGGGGGGTHVGTASTGGAGGGGAGKSTSSSPSGTAGDPGTANTGGGGGGGTSGNGAGGAGGSGIVIVRYAITGGNKSNASQNAKSTNGLAGLWSFDGPDMYGVTAYDRSGNGNNGTLTNGPTRVIGKIGQALRFDGVNDYISVPDAAMWDFGSSDFTVSWWEYRTSNANGSAALVRDNTMGYPAFIIGYSSGGANLEIYMSSTGSSWDIANAKSLGAVTLNRWNYFTVTRSGTTFTAYKNAVQTDTWTSSGTLITSILPLEFGRYAAADTYFYRGSLDDVRIYNRTLTAAEVKNLYLQGK